MLEHSIFKQRTSESLKETIGNILLLRELHKRDAAIRDKETSIRSAGLIQNEVTDQSLRCKHTIIHVKTRTGIREVAKLSDTQFFPTCLKVDAGKIVEKPVCRGCGDKRGVSSIFSLGNVHVGAVLAQPVLEICGIVSVKYNSHADSRHVLRSVIGASHVVVHGVGIAKSLNEFKGKGTTWIFPAIANVQQKGPAIVDIVSEALRSFPTTGIVLGTARNRQDAVLTKRLRVLTDVLAHATVAAHKGHLPIFAVLVQTKDFQIGVTPGLTDLLRLDGEHVIRVRKRHQCVVGEKRPVDPSLVVFDRVFDRDHDPDEAKGEHKLKNLCGDKF